MTFRLGRKIAYYAGWTRERKVGWSEPISAEAIIIERNFIEEKEGDQSFYAVDPSLGVSMDDYYPERHLLKLKIVDKWRDEDNPLVFEEDNKEWFDRYEVGDKVQIIYKQRLETIRNYKPPNFDEKTIVSSRVIKTELERLIGRLEE